MEILRIENDDGEGPYITGFCEFRDIGDAPYGSTRCPSPVNDGVNETHRPSLFNAARCGFLDQEQLRSWFTDTELDVLHDGGYHVSYIRLRGGSEIGIGKKQITFYPRDVEVSTAVSITSIKTKE